MPNSNYNPNPRTQEELCDEISRLRNRHVAKLLTILGDLAPEHLTEYVERTIKTSYSMFAADIKANVIRAMKDNSNREHKENHEQDSDQNPEGGRGGCRPVTDRHPSDGSEAARRDVHG